MYPAGQPRLLNMDRLSIQNIFGVTFAVPCVLGFVFLWVKRKQAVERRNAKT